MYTDSTPKAGMKTGRRRSNFNIRASMPGLAVHTHADSQQAPVLSFRSEDLVLVLNEAEGGFWIGCSQLLGNLLLKQVTLRVAGPGLTSQLHLQDET